MSCRAVYLGCGNAKDMHQGPAVYPPEGIQGLPCKQVCRSGYVQYCTAAPMPCAMQQAKQKLLVKTRRACDNLEGECDGLQL